MSRDQFIYLKSPSLDKYVYIFEIGVLEGNSSITKTKYKNCDNNHDFHIKKDIFQFIDHSKSYLTFRVLNERQILMYIMMNHLLILD